MTVVPSVPSVSRLCTMKATPARLIPGRAEGGTHSAGVILCGSMRAMREDGPPEMAESSLGEIRDGAPKRAVWSVEAGVVGHERADKGCREKAAWHRGEQAQAADLGGIEPREVRRHHFEVRGREGRKHRSRA